MKSAPSSAPAIGAQRHLARATNKVPTSRQTSSKRELELVFSPPGGIARGKSGTPVNHSVAVPRAQSSSAPHASHRHWDRGPVDVASIMAVSLAYPGSQVVASSAYPRLRKPP